MAVAERLMGVQHFIDGEETASASGRTFESIDPSTGQAIATVAFGEAEDVDRAVRSSHRAFRQGDWAKAAPRHRATVMRRLGDLIREHADEIGTIEARDSGKPIAQARREAVDAAGFFTFYAGLAELQ